MATDITKFLARGIVKKRREKNNAIFGTGFTPLPQLRMLNPLLWFKSMAAFLCYGNNNTKHSKDSAKRIRSCSTGFTLIELLVVVALIAMILSFVFIQMKDARARSRDAAREANMKDIQNALNIHVTALGFFPICANEVVINGTSDCLSSALIAGKAAVAVPVDPIGGFSGICGGPDSYVFCYQSDGVSFVLKYRLETDSISGKSEGWQTATP